MTRTQAIIESVERIQADLTELNSRLEDIHYDPETVDDRAIHDLEIIQSYITRTLKRVDFIEKERRGGENA